MVAMPAAVRLLAARLLVPLFWSRTALARASATTTRYSATVSQQCQQHLSAPQLQQQPGTADKRGTMAPGPWPALVSRWLPMTLYTAAQVRDNEEAAAASQGIDMYTLMTSAGQAAFNVLDYRYRARATAAAAARGRANKESGHVPPRLLVVAGKVGRQAGLRGRQAGLGEMLN